MSADSGTALPNTADASRLPIATQRKPRLALFIATACGIGYIPVAPGTCGSAAGVFLTIVVTWLTSRGTLAAVSMVRSVNFWREILIPGYAWFLIALAVAAIGVWASSQVSRYSREKDPQFVVVDEVSGQLFTYAFAFTVGNWKYLLLGFILFRVFDIWKPFPARQAESLPGGWGIMADDWVAGIYAAIGLWVARAAGL
jgi:phosphatidylglycerophosphatase A